MLVTTGSWRATVLTGGSVEWKCQRHKAVGSSAAGAFAKDMAKVQSVGNTKVKSVGSGRVSGADSWWQRVGGEVVYVAVRSR